MVKRMNIACLAWGSLVWDPRNLPIQRQWFDDGPFARIEFARQSDDGRITLVLDGKADSVRLLWARMTLSNIDEAMKALGDRERITAADWKSRIGKWCTGDEDPELIPSMSNWAQAHGIDVAIWTALPPRYKRQGEASFTMERPPLEWVVKHLQGLTGSRRETAERYFRRTPPQIDTEYRRHVEATLGWYYLQG